MNFELVCCFAILYCFMKILLVDSSYITGHGILHMMLNLTKGIALVEYLKDFTGAGRVCRTREVDAIIFTTTSLETHGIPFLRRLSAQWPKIRVYAMVPVLDRISIDYLRRYTNLCGVFSAETKPGDFHDMLNRPWRSGTVNLTPEIEEVIFSTNFGYFSEEKVALLDRLSEREYDVLMLSINGDRGREIAEKLNISAKTVCTHRCRIRQKLAARSMQEVFRMVMEIRQESMLTQNGLATLANETGPIDNRSEAAIQQRIRMI